MPDRHSYAPLRHFGAESAQPVHSIFPMRPKPITRQAAWQMVIGVSYHDQLDVAFGRGHGVGYGEFLPVQEINQGNPIESASSMCGAVNTPCT
jgi:hypothetical protein